MVILVGDLRERSTGTKNDTDLDRGANQDKGVSMICIRPCNWDY